MSLIHNFEPIKNLDITQRFSSHKRFSSTFQVGHNISSRLPTNSEACVLFCVDIAVDKAAFEFKQNDQVISKFSSILSRCCLCSRQLSGQVDG